MEDAEPAGSSSQMASQDERAVVLITTVDIGGGRSEKIELRQGDSPEDAARAFCEQHSIPTSVVGPLAEHIMDNLKKANASKAAQLAAEEQEAELDTPQVGEHAQPTKLSFENGMNDTLNERLSNKLLPVGDNSHLLSVTASLGTGGRPLSSRSNRAASVASDRGMSRVTQSAEGSPTAHHVHHRLYNHAVDMKHRHDMKRRAVADELTASLSIRHSSMSWISQEMMRDRTATGYENYGDMLYFEGRQSALSRQSKIAAFQAQREQSEMAGVTFMPQITQLAAALWAGDDLDSQPVWQRLSVDKRAKTLQRIQEMKEAREQAELAQCTFKPQISRISAALMAERLEAGKALNLTAHDQLFADAQRRQQKMEELQSWLPDHVTFQPVMNRSKAAESALARSLERLAASGSASPEQLPVVDRLYLSYDKSKSRLEEKRAALEKTVDPSTGRAYFAPEVGRGPRNVSRNQAGLPVGDYLYASGVEKLAKRDEKLEAERQAQREAASASHTNAASARIFDKLRAKRFAQIFEYLDSEGTGTLDLVGITRIPTSQMDNLDNEVREDVETAAALHAAACGVPLAPEPDADQSAPLPPAKPIDLAGFSALMDKALISRRKPRAYLVPSPNSKPQPAPTFRPAINQRSRDLAARLRPADVPLHEALHSVAASKQQKLDAARKEAQATAVADCTFAPKLQSYWQPVEGRAMRAARAAIAQGATIASQREHARATAAAEAAAVAAAPASGVAGRTLAAQLIQQQAAELEAELQSALAGVSLAEERLGALEQGGGASASELRATEAMLLDMLAQSPGSELDSEADTAVINQLHQLMAEPAPAPAPARAPGALSHARSASRADSTKGAPASTTAQQLEELIA